MSVAVMGRRRPLLIEMLVALVLASALTAYPTRALYSVSAETESATVILTGVTAWQVHGARLLEPDAPPSALPGLVQLRAGTIVTMRRMGTGAVQLTLEAPPSTATPPTPIGQVFIGQVFDDDDDQPGAMLTSPSTVEIPLRAEDSLTLKMRGDVRLEGPMTQGTFGTIPMLRSGAVTINAASLLGWGKTYHYVYRRELSAGDEFRLDEPLDGRGFVRVDGDQPGLTVVYAAMGRTGEVLRFGHTYTYDVSPLDRVQADPVLWIAWTLAGLLMAAWLALPAIGATAVVGALGLLALLVPASAVAQIATVHLISDARGIGTPRWWEGQCYVVTPAHVVAGGADVEVVGASRRLARAESQWQNAGLDVAILRVTAGAENVCTARAWTSAGRLDDLLARETRGTLRSLGEDGGERRMAVAISKVQGGFVDVTPTLAGTEISQGQSGSALEVGGRRAGMLLSVEDGRGRVMRADYLESILEAFFVKRAWPTPGRAICFRHDDATTGVARALADAIRKAGAKPVLGCKRPPAGADLLSLSGQETTDHLGDDWIVSVHATIVLKIAEERDERHRALRATGSSTLDAARAHAAVAGDVAEQIGEASLPAFVGATNAEDAGGMRR